MTVEDAKSVIKELEEKGLTKEQICESFHRMYMENTIDLEQFEALSKLAGYELNQDYIEDEKRRQKYSDLSYILGMKLSVTEEIYVLKKIISVTHNKEIKEDLKEILFFLRYSMQDETIKAIQSQKDNIRDIVIEKRKMDEEDLVGKLKIKCRKCSNCSILSPYDSYCNAYDAKPVEVLRFGEDCPEFKEDLKWLGIDGMLINKGLKKVKLVVNDNGKINEYPINSKEDLIEGIKDYVQVFIPEDDDLMYDLYKEGKYDSLLEEFGKLNEINFNYINNRVKDDNEKKIKFKDLLNYAVTTKEIIELLKQVEQYGSITDIICELECFNKLLKKGGYDIVLRIKNDIVNE